MFLSNICTVIQSNKRITKYDINNIVPTHSVTTMHPKILKYIMHKLSVFRNN